MSEFNDSDVQQIADEIECYLKNHPNAADTIEGITQWWISRIRVEEATVTVSKALEILGREGKVKKTVTTEGKEIYSFSKNEIHSPIS